MEINRDLFSLTHCCCYEHKASGQKTQYSHSSVLCQEEQAIQTPWSNSRLLYFAEEQCSISLQLYPPIHFLQILEEMKRLLVSYDVLVWLKKVQEPCKLMLTCESIGGVWRRCCSCRPKHSGTERASAIPPYASCRGVWTQQAADGTPAIWWWTWCPSCRSSGMAAPCLCLGPSQRARSRTGESGRTWKTPACTSGCQCSGALAIAAWFSSSCWAQARRGIIYLDESSVDCRSLKGGLNSTPKKNHVYLWFWSLQYNAH